MFMAKHLTNLYRKFVRIENGKMKRKRRNVREKCMVVLNYGWKTSPVFI